MIPVAAEDRQGVKASLEVDDHVAEISSVTGSGGNLIVALAVKKRTGKAHPFKIHVECQDGKTIDTVGQLEVERGNPEKVQIKTILGSERRVDVPYTGQLWKDANFTARLEPPGHGLKLSMNQGVMKAGAKVFPFRIIFAPQKPTPTIALLVVVFDGNDEYCVEIWGSVSGCESQSRGQHHKARLAAAASDLRVLGSADGISPLALEE
jgi:hypothetical protein